MQMKGGDGGGRPPVRTGVIYQRHSINIDSQGPVFLFPPTECPFRPVDGFRRATVPLPLARWCARYPSRPPHSENDVWRWAIQIKTVPRYELGKIKLYFVFVRDESSPFFSCGTYHSLNAGEGETHTQINIISRRGGTHKLLKMKKYILGFFCGFFCGFLSLISL